jgi:RNA polymerase sigma factor (sigma-70 family)
LPTPDKLLRFEEAILPHLDAAFNLARWLMRNPADADDAVQDACLRALRFFDGFRGADARVWLLTIVRNACYSKLKRARRQEQETVFDEEIHRVEAGVPDPETAVLQMLDAEAVRHALEALPEEFREVIVMRELEGLSYKEIAAVIDAPLGTVMSRIARGRARLEKLLAPGSGEGH